MDINRLSSAEITNLWVHYIRETMAICVSNYVLNSVKDREVINVFEFALQLSNNHIKILNKIFKQENFPNPNGFTDEDVKVNAPPLFSDNFWLTIFMACLCMDLNYIVLHLIAHQEKI
jgi:hypothetical protein